MCREPAENEHPPWLSGEKTRRWFGAEPLFKTLDHREHHVSHLMQDNQDSATRRRVVQRPSKKANATEDPSKMLAANCAIRNLISKVKPDAMFKRPA
jgi:hypothetical protein